MPPVLSVLRAVTLLKIFLLMHAVQVLHHIRMMMNPIRYSDMIAEIRQYFFQDALKKSDYYEFRTVVEGFLQKGSKSNLEYLSLYKYANTREGRERTAYLEYLEFQGEEQRYFLKKRGKQVFMMLLEESDEEAIKFLGLGILTPKAKKDILEIVSKGENSTLSAAVLEAINDGKGAKVSKSKFSV